MIQFRLMREFPNRDDRVDLRGSVGGVVVTITGGCQLLASYSQPAAKRGGEAAEPQLPSLSPPRFSWNPGRASPVALKRASLF